MYSISTIDFPKSLGSILMPKKLKYFVLGGYNLPHILLKLGTVIRPTILFYHKESKSAGLVTL